MVEYLESSNHGTTEGVRLFFFTMSLLKYRCEQPQDAWQTEDAIEILLLGPHSAVKYVLSHINGTLTQLISPVEKQEDATKK